MMVCPKCGHVQEKRPDCLKCGVVFSKYYALFPNRKSSEADSVEDPALPGMTDQESNSLIADLQMQVREMSTRFSDLEFEKAERTRMRTDLKNIEQQIQSDREQVSARLEQFEKRLEQNLGGESRQEREVLLPSLLTRLEKLEDRLESLDNLTRQINDLTDKTGAHAQQVAEIQNQLSVLRDEVLEMKYQVGQAEGASESNGAKTPLENDVHAIRKYLDEFRRILSNQQNR